jgi:hypothetical protein
VPEREPHLPSPAVEIVPSKNVHPYKYAGENIELHGMNIFKVLAFPRLLYIFQLY